MADNGNCGGGCAHCSGALDKAVRQGPQGLKLVAWAILAFLVPLLVAIAAACVVEGSQTKQAFAMYGILILMLILLPMGARRWLKGRGESA